MNEYDIIRTAKVKDLTPDDLNANRGTERGDYQAKTDKIGKYMIGMSVPPKMTQAVAQAVIEQWLL